MSIANNSKNLHAKTVSAVARGAKAPTTNIGELKNNYNADARWRTAEAIYEYCADAIYHQHERNGTLRKGCNATPLKGQAAFAIH